MTNEQAAHLQETLDEIAPIIRALGKLIIRRQDAVNLTGINKNTFASHPAFEEHGKRKTYIEIGEIAVVKQRKGTRKRPR